MLLLLFLLSAVGGQYLLFQTYRFHIRNLAKQSLQKMAASDGDVLRFSIHDFSCKLPFQKVQGKDDEIIYQGEYFDVKMFSIKGDSIYLYAYRDVREKMLMAQFEKMQREHDTSPAAVLLRNFSTIFTFLPNETIETPLIEETNIRTSDLCVEQYYSALILPEAPPPRLS